LFLLIVACAGGAIIDSETWTNDSRGPALAFCRKWDSRLRIVRVDSAGLGFYFAEAIRDRGYRTEGINVSGSATDKERFANSKAERYWCLRERFQRGEVSGLTDEMLSELAAITWLIDTRGAIAIEGKVEVKAALGHSPDLAEALMIAIGSPSLEPMSWTAAPAIPTP
jgi:phage terminase large subunit